MKKYLFGALALPLLFACSAEDLPEKKVLSNDQFAGIETVDATFSMDEGTITRMDNGTGWTLANGDKYGFAWMGDGAVITNAPADGKAYQNHPLIQTDGIFKPQTSIYVGKYFIYHPYDEETVSPEPIKFNSLANQVVTEGMNGDPWNKLAENAIIIGDKWTRVTVDGWDDAAGTTWDKAGIKKGERGHYKVYAAFFSNQTGLDMKYKNNCPEFKADQTVSGATDITLKYLAGSSAESADIYGGSINLAGAANSFTYAPTISPVEDDPAINNHKGTYWADRSNLSDADGFNFTAAAIAFTAADKEKGIATGTEGSTGWIWLNSLPVIGGNGTVDTEVTPVLETTYGQVTVQKNYDTGANYKVGDCAYELKGKKADGTYEWWKLGDTEDVANLKWKLADHNTFVNYYGNHKGKFAFEVDFSKGVMNNMHIKNDTHLQKALKYYLASKKNEDVTLILDGASETDKTFKLSKISIALLQTINATANKVLVKGCTEHNAPAPAGTPVKIIVTQDGQTGDLAGKTEVPRLDKVFAESTDVYLAKETTWTWTEGAAAEGKIPEGILPIDKNVASLTNEGNLTVNATNVQLSEIANVAAQPTIYNAKEATMNITEVTTVKNTLNNLGTINVGSKSNLTAELRAYDVEITNDATALNACGTINNYGVVGVSDIGTAGKFNNYGLIDVKDPGAITLLSTNELVSNFDNHFDATTNKMGTVNLPSPTALVSVNNKDANGFIKYRWPATETTYVTPKGNVKYNTIVVTGNIEFTEKEAEIQFIEFDGTRTQVVNPGGLLTNLKGIIVNPGKSIILEKGNRLAPKDGTFLGAGATVYNGGTFTHNAAVAGTTASNYFGDWQTTQIVKY